MPYRDGNGNILERGDRVVSVGTSRPWGRIINHTELYDSLNPHRLLIEWDSDPIYDPRRTWELPINLIRIGPPHRTDPTRMEYEATWQEFDEGSPQQSFDQALSELTAAAKRKQAKNRAPISPIFKDR